MAARKLFCLSGGVLNKCFLAKVQCCKQNFHTTTIYRRFQGSKKFTNRFKSVDQIQIVEPDVPIQRDSKILWRNFYFSVAFSGAVFVGAVIWEYESISHAYRKTWYKQFTFQRSGWRGEIQSFWNSLSQGQKIFAPILFTNIAVFMAWRMPALKSTMLRYFMLSLNSHTSWALVSSMFSHYSLLHLAANMFVLHSFCGYVTARLGKEQFVALYLTSGIVSGLFSQIYRFAIRSPSASVGASGAIAGIIGFMCFEFPDVGLMPIFFPFVSIRAENAFYALTFIETMGCIQRWKIFDHAAHLSGLTFGWLWHAWIRENVWYKRGVVIDMWHKLRSGTPPEN